MAQKGKNYYGSVYDLEKRKTILNKMFLNVNECNIWIKEMKEKYPNPRYEVHKELA